MLTKALFFSKHYKLTNNCIVKQKNVIKEIFISMNLTQEQNHTRINLIDIY